MSHEATKPRSHGGAKRRFRSTPSLALAMTLSCLTFGGATAQQNSPERVPPDAVVRDQGDVPPNCSPIQVSLATPRSNYRIGEAPQLDVRLTNVSDEPVVLVGALPCSDSRGQFPHCYFQVKGPELPNSYKGQFCRGDDWLQVDHFVDVMPGSSLDPFAPPFSKDADFKNAFPLEGDYRVRFCYSTFEADIRRWDGHRRERSFDEWKYGIGKPIWELFQQVPQISICSNEVVISYKGYLGFSDAVTDGELSNHLGVVRLDDFSKETHCPPISCRLSTEKSVYKVGETPQLDIQVRNDSPRDLYLVKSLEGSTRRGRYPHCYYEISRPAGAPEPGPVWACGNMAEIKISDFVQVKPSETFDPSVSSVHFWNQFKIAGEYRIRFRYSTLEPDIGLWDGFPSRFQHGSPEWVKTEGKPLMDRFAQVPKVSIVSNEVVIRFEE